VCIVQQPEADKLAAKADKMILTPSMPKRRATKAPRMNLPMLHIVASEGHVDALVALLEAQADVRDTNTLATCAITIIIGVDFALLCTRR